MMRRLLTTLLVLMGTLGVVDIASAMTREELPKACQAGDARACFNLGQIYYFGKGVTQDKSKAVELYRQACDLKNERGCKNYAKLKTGKR